MHSATGGKPHIDVLLELQAEIKRRNARDEIEYVPEKLHRDTMLWLGTAALIVAFFGVGVRLILG